MSIKSVMPSNHLILCHPLLLVPSIFPSIRVFSNESALHIRWPKYWSQLFDLPFGTQGRSWRLNEADFLQIRNGGHGKDLYPEAPQHPALFDNRRYTALLMFYSVGTFALAAKLLWIGGIQSWIAKDCLHNKKRVDSGILITGMAALQTLISLLKRYTRENRTGGRG